MSKGEKMKPQHIHALQEILKKPPEGLSDLLVDTMIRFLNENDKANQMTFEELCECCADSPPVTLPSAVWNQIGLAYDNGKKLKKSYNHAYKLYSHAAKKGSHAALYNCAVSFFYGDGVILNLDEAKKYFLAYIEKLENDKEKNRIEVAYFLGMIALVKGNVDEAITYFKLVPKVEESHYKTAILMLEALQKNDYASICQELSSLNRNDFLQAMFVNVLRQQNYPAIEQIQKSSLLKLYRGLDSKSSSEQKKEKMKSSSSKSQYGLSAESVSSMDLEPESFWKKDARRSSLDLYDRRSALSKLVSSRDALENKEVNLKKRKRDFEEVTEELRVAHQKGDKAKTLESLSHKQKKARTDYEEAKKEYDSVAHVEDVSGQPSFSSTYFAAEQKELLRQHYTQQRFFDPKRTKKAKTHELAHQLQKQRLPVPASDNGKDEKDSSDTQEASTKWMDVSGKTGRSLITAERSIVENSVQLCGYDFAASSPHYNELGLAHNKKESVLVGSTKVSYTQHSKYPSHLGDYRGDDIGTYGDIYVVLDALTQTDEECTKKQKEMELAKRMLHFSKTVAPVTLSELRKFKHNSTKEDVTKINQIFYHILIKENARRMVAKEMRHDIPVTIIQQRALKLIAAGFLSLKDVFKSDAPFGVVTGSYIYNNHREVMEKIYRVNRMYNDCILKPKLYRKDPSFLADHPGADVIASCSELRDELRNSYGGDSDTDSEYDSSDEGFEEVSRNVLPENFRLKL